MPPDSTVEKDSPTEKDSPAEKWILCLYVAGMTPAAKRALSNIQAICDEHLEGNCSIEVTDLLEKPALAEDRQIFAVPTLVREFPLPLRKIIGDLGNSGKVLEGLDLEPALP
jgi:circadian clock protein KaiB